MAPNAASTAAASTGATASAPFRVHSPNVAYNDHEIVSTFLYETSLVEQDVKTGAFVVTPQVTPLEFHTSMAVPKLGLLLVGLGGNNGTTVTAGILANKMGLSWRTRQGVQHANYFGSLTQASTVRLGRDASGKDVYIPFSKILPMVDPNTLVIGGWDISNLSLAAAMERAQVLEPDLQRQLAPVMESIVPWPSVYYPDFIASNQTDRANNTLSGESKKAHLEQIRGDIARFKQENTLDSVVVVWTANTERFAELVPGVNDTADNLLAAIERSEKEIAPSTIFAVACILEGVPFINGSPQNTFVPGCIELSERHKSFIAGDDFKSGQTKMKSVLVDFLIGAGIKPLSITSYNHLGNNDGRNLSAPSQFRSKEISKSNVVDDMVASNPILYSKPDEHPDHVVVIKYVPAVGDSKRALDEYYNEIFLGGRNTIAMHNTCEDSLLASPLIIDLAILAELCTRIKFRRLEDDNGKITDSELQGMHPILSILSYLVKAPLVRPGKQVVNSLFKQRAALENLFRACVGLSPQNDMLLEDRLFDV